MLGAPAKIKMKNKTMYTFFVFSMIAFNSSCSARVPEWHMINVNHGSRHGDAHLLIDGDVTLIDAGYEDEAQKHVVPFLRSKRISKIDNFYISHAHYDHYNGIRAVINAGIKVENVYFSEPPADLRDCCFRPKEWAEIKSIMRNSGAKLHDVAQGFRQEYKASNMEILHAHKSASGADLNDMSLIMRWTIGETRVLFTGDLNTRVGKALASNKRIEADILKMPHHGGVGHAPPEFFDAVNPKLAMFPSPVWVENSWRGEKSFGWAKSRGVAYCSNSSNGNVAIKFYTGKYKAQPSRQGKACPLGYIKSKPREKEIINKMPLSVLLLLLD